MEPLDGLMQFAKDGGDMLTWLLLYVAWKLNDLGKSVTELEKRVIVLENA